MTVQTQPQATRDLRQAARQGLLPARGSGWLSGFGNMLSKELGRMVPHPPLAVAGFDLADYH